MIGTVQEIGRTQKGTPKIRINNEWHYPGRCPIDGLTVGQQVDFAVSTFTTSDGKPLKGLESWKPLAAAPVANGHAPLKASDDAEMRFISNCVGQAIAAGTIKNPDEIGVWFRAAKAALVPHDFNDDIKY